jgi:hypothetical protein
MQKKIIVQWEHSSSQWDKPYGSKRMTVIESNHPRFTVGSRFDYGFMEIATTVDGYVVEVRPM